MSNKTEKAVEDYFTRLLSEPELDKDIKAQPLQKLLSKVSAPAAEPARKAPVSEAPAVAKPAPSVSTAPASLAEITPTKTTGTKTTPTESPVVAEKPVAASPKVSPPAPKTEVAPELAPTGSEAALKESLPDKFQVLYFEVAGLTLAVPLTSLGGIQKLKKVNQLFGKPDWFMGVQLNREQQINVVDTTRWVMPEKYTDQLAQSLDYQYIILLGDSGWGLACERLVDADPLDHGEIKWRQSPGKRPWLAGTVKSRMCGLLAVDELVGLLEQGLNS